MHLRANKKNRGNVYLYDAIGVDKEGDVITLQDIIETEEPSPEKLYEVKSDIKKLSEEAMSSLKPNEYQVIGLRYGFVTGKCETQNTVAQIMGISRSYVSRIEKAAIEKLKEAFR